MRISPHGWALRFQLKGARAAGIQNTVSVEIENIQPSAFLDGRFPVTP
jgi:hypothetical protein